MGDRLQNTYPQRAAFDLAVVQALQGLHGHGALDSDIGLEIEDRNLANLRTRNAGIARRPLRGMVVKITSGRPRPSSTGPMPASWHLAQIFS